MNPKNEIRKIADLLRSEIGTDLMGIATPGPGDVREAIVTLIGRYKEDKARVRELEADRDAWHRAATTLREERNRARERGDTLEDKWGQAQSRAEALEKRVRHLEGIEALYNARQKLDAARDELAIFPDERTKNGGQP